ncbi:ROK family protein, partial [Streptomyces flavofungini]|uniref:ROK family protein n=1 Tax=Streptomyces flavofungini TaxID=68200 RepID=UPI0034DFD0FF
MTDHRRPQGLRRANTAAVLRAVLDTGPLPRADLADRLGLAAGTVSRIVAPAVTAGLLRELPALSGGGGRPRVPVDLVRGARYAVGLHLGRRRTTAGLVDLRGGVAAVRVHERGPLEPAGLVAGAADVVRDLLKDAGDVPVLGIGAATVGWVDPGTGTVVDNEALGWHDVPLRALLTDATGLPTVVDSQARAQATAELWFGDAHGDEAASVHLFTGNVIDAAFALGRRVHTGARSAAGRIGHLPVLDVRAARDAPDGDSGGSSPACSCGRAGVLQAVATDLAVTAEAVRRGIVTPDADFTDVVAAALAGDGPADTLLRERARYIGAAVAHLVDVFDPDTVVLSGGMLAVPAHLDEVRAEAVRRIGGGWDPERVRLTT